MATMTVKDYYRHVYPKPDATYNGQPFRNIAHRPAYDDMGNHQGNDSGVYIITTGTDGASLRFTPVPPDTLIEVE